MPRYKAQKAYWTALWTMDVRKVDALPCFATIEGKTRSDVFIGELLEALFVSRALRPSAVRPLIHDLFNKTYQTPNLHPPFREKRLRHYI